MHKPFVLISGLPDHLKIIDMSADFRLLDMKTYAEWYGHEHRAPVLQGEAVYGLTEIYRIDPDLALLVLERRVRRLPGRHVERALVAVHLDPALLARADVEARGQA